MIKSIAPSPSKGGRGNGQETSAKRSSIELKGEEVGSLLDAMAKPYMAAEISFTNVIKVYSTDPNIYRVDSLKGLLG